MNNNFVTQNPYAGYVTPQAPQYTRYAPIETHNPNNFIATTTPPCFLKGRPVVSFEEARASQIDFDGSLFIFPDIGNKKIYTKQINMDGTASMRVYSLVEEPSAATEEPATEYITRAEFERIIAELRAATPTQAQPVSVPAKQATPTQITF